MQHAIRLERPSKIVSMITQFGYNLAQDLQKYVEVQTGKGYFGEAEYQQVDIPRNGDSSSDNQQSHQNTMKTQEQEQQYDDFHLQVDEPCGGSGDSIKTYQFNSGFIAPSKPLGKVIQSPPEVKIIIEEHFGYNSKQKQCCLYLSPNHYVVSLGCTILLVRLSEQKNKDIQMFQQHVYEICSLHYSQQHHILLSGSKGLKSQIVVWRISEKKPKESLQIKFLNKFYLQRKVEGVGILRMLNKQVMLVVDSLNIHSGNQIRAYDIDAGVKLNFNKKFEQKIMSMHVDQATETIYLATNKGLIKIETPLSNPIISTISTIKNLISISPLQNLLVVGDQNENIHILQSSGTQIHEIQIHKGFIFNLHTASITLTMNEKKTTRNLIFSSGTRDNCVKISAVDIIGNGKSVKIQEFGVVEMGSYCTAISGCAENVLMGWRDGSIILYDAKNKIKKYERLSAISCVKNENASFSLYNRISQKIAFNYKNQIYQLNPSKIEFEVPSSKIKKVGSFTGVQVKPVKNLKCFDIYRQKIVQIHTWKEKQYRIQLHNLSESNKSESQFSKQLNLSKQGKPCVVKLNEDLIAIGSKYGYLIIVMIKSGVIVKSTQKHEKSVEDIVLQQGAIKQNQSYYIKTVSGSQLSHWQLKIGQSPGVEPITKSSQIKNIQWREVCKYCWQTKNIWEEMTHYQDIEKVAVVGDESKYICVSMGDGMLRIYRYPSSKNNYVEFRVFPQKFRVFSCGKNNQRLLCEANMQFLLIQLKEQQ